MLIVNRREMQEIDRLTIDEYGISDELLMENAGVEFVNRLLLDFRPDKYEKIGVLCGGGNNGGDGFVIARHLQRRGLEATVFLFVRSEKLKGIALSNFERLSLFGIEVRDCSTAEALEKSREQIRGCRFLVDALLGTGFRGLPRGTIKDAIALINSSRIPVIAIDMPSGVDADGSQEDMLAVKASATYTVGCLKYGLVDFPGKEAAGYVEVLDIGFPPDAVRRASKPAVFIDAPLVNRLVPRRKGDSHKGTYGHLAVLGGRSGYEGASLLASRAALRAGCGLVTLFLSKESRVQKPDEVIAGYLPADVDNTPDDLDLEELLKNQNVLVIGPGLGVSKGTRTIVQKALQLQKKILIDADGLNTLSVFPDLLGQQREEIVITPHIGEMMRLTGLTKEEIKADKRGVSLNVAKKYNFTVVLKDAVTVVATAEGEIFINNGGVAALSKGGSGDVLSGIIGSLMARGLSGRDAAISGVYLHTESGRLAESRLGADSVQAGDLIATLPDVLSSLQKVGKEVKPGFRD